MDFDSDEDMGRVGWGRGEEFEYGEDEAVYEVLPTAEQEAATATEGSNTTNTTRHGPFKGGKGFEKPLQIAHKEFKNSFKNAALAMDIYSDIPTFD